MYLTYPANIQKNPAAESNNITGDYCLLVCLLHLIRDGTYPPTTSWWDRVPTWQVPTCRIETTSLPFTSTPLAQLTTTATANCKLQL